jgi:hypothetical protein
MERPLADKRPLGPFLNLNSEVDVPEPKTSEQAVRVFTPTKSRATDSKASDIESKVESMVSANVSVSSVPGGLMTAADAAGRGPVEFPHEVLDVTETFIKKDLGIKEKSTLIAANPGGKTLQSCFVPVEGEFTDKQLAEIDELASFVTGLDLKSEQVEQRLYIDSGVTKFNHIALDVMEIVTSRVSFDSNISVQDNSMLVRAPNKQ